MKDVLTRLKNKFNRHRFHTDCEPVFATAKAKCDPEASFSLLSMLQKKDLTMYLVSVKSFCRYLSPRAVYVVNDGSLGEPELDLLREHLENPVFLRKDDYVSDACPRGGTWERLLAISRLVEDDYIIQLDADLMFLSRPEEIAACVADRRGFTLGDFPGQRFQSMPERVRISRDKHGGNTHVQVMAETNFDRLADHENLKYVRGCSGFAGFPRGSFSTGFVEGISSQMRTAIGDKWAEWGSEQVMSNIVVANLDNAEVLPFPKYGNCNVYEDASAHAMVHFIGTCRFSSPLYRELGRKVLRELQ